jgi:hypothetical protein
MTNPHLQTLMQKEISRKEFLGIVGLAALSIFGFSHIVKLLTGKSLDTHHFLDGYSGSVYGGRKKL